MQPHPDLDLLALQALGEPALDQRAVEHVAGCPECSSTVSELARTVRAVRGPREDGVERTIATSSDDTATEAARVPVPAHVWQGIAAELGLDPSVRPASVGPSGLAPTTQAPRTRTPSARSTSTQPTSTRSTSAQPTSARSSATRSPVPTGTPHDDLASRRDQRSGLRRAAPLLAVAAAGLAVGVAGTAVVASLGGQDEPDGPRVLAAADLEAFGIGEGTPVAGSARLALPAGTGATGPDGTQDRVLQVWLDDLPDAGGGEFLEAWLIDPATGAMVSLGPVGNRVGSGATVDLTVPRGLDVDTYSLVDVSAEPLDGDPTHSGDSLLRGTLGT